MGKRGVLSNTTMQSHMIKCHLTFYYAEKLREQCCQHEFKIMMKVSPEIGSGEDNLIFLPFCSNYTKATWSCLIISTQQFCSALF